MSAHSSHTIIQLPNSQAEGIRENRNSGTNYTGFSVLNRGGMGTIFRTTDLNIGREVAMKMAVNSDDTDEALKRLIHEARVTANLEHPNIVPVHEINSDNNNDVYYTMKYVQGDNLGKILDSLAQNDPEYIDKYPLIRLLNIFLRVCDGVAFAHSKGVIHRDLKPENIMVGDYGEVLLMDWGISKVLNKVNFGLDDSEINIQVNLEALSKKCKGKNSFMTTRTGEVFGTPAFMAPEQIKGQNEDVDGRTDIYALGGILYYILALHCPVQNEDVAELFKTVLEGNVVAPNKLKRSLDHCMPHTANHQIPDSLSAVTMKCLEVNPDARYKEVKTLQEDIRKFMNGFATEAEHASKLKLFSLMVSRNSFFVMIILLILTLTLVGYVKDLSSEKNLKTIKTYYENNMESLMHSNKASDKSLGALREEIPDLLQIAESFSDKNDLKSASSVIAVILSLDGTLPEALCLQGEIYEKGRRFKNAVDSYRSALRRNPDFVAASEGIRRCSAKIGQTN